MSYFFTTLAGIAIGFMLCVAVTTPGHSEHKVQKATCKPYTVLAHYEVEESKYVVCGDYEHKQYEIK